MPRLSKMLFDVASLAHIHKKKLIMQDGLDQYCVGMFKYTQHLVLLFLTHFPQINIPWINAHSRVYKLENIYYIQNFEYM
jgi:hypothetical protein